LVCWTDANAGKVMKIMIMDKISTRFLSVKLILNCIPIHSLFPL
jgi:hypothetical protein